jgi:hypothetical protein
MIPFTQVTHPVLLRLGSYGGMDTVHCHEDVKVIWRIVSRTDSRDTEKTSRGKKRNGREDEDSIKLAQHGVRQVARWSVIFKLGICYQRVSYIH